MKTFFRLMPIKILSFILALMSGTACIISCIMALLALDGLPIIGPSDTFYDVNVVNSFIITAISLSVFLTLSIILIVVSGKVSGTEEPTLAPLNKIPFDIFLVIAGIGSTIAMPLTSMVLFDNGTIRQYSQVIEDYNTYTTVEYVGFLWYYLIGLSAACLGGITFLLGTLMSLSARVKCGKWWANTVIYRLLRIIGKVIKSFSHMVSVVFYHLPDVWKIAIAFLAYLIIDWILLYAAYENYNNELALFLFVIFNLAILVGLCYIGINFDTLEKGTRRLAAGQLDSKIETINLRFIFRRHAENINAIGDGMQLAVEQKLKSERMKTELITNVSHDIKTPITSIVNYADLLSTLPLSEPAAEYAGVLLRQSKRLAKLTSDIFEASKASTGNIPVELSTVDVAELISQSVGEYDERLAEQNIIPVVTATQEVHAIADGKLLWRIADNLLSNVCKYALPGTRLYVDVRQTRNHATITFKNISRQPLNVDSEELTERFVRGDASRNTEGSGLGLNIAKSFTELQNGTLEIMVDGDLFKVEIHLILDDTTYGGLQ